MLEKETKISEYGSSMMMLIPKDILNDSMFPFRVEILDGKPKDIKVHLKIDKEKKRLIIEQGGKENE